MAFKDTGKTPVEAEVAIHGMRITLTSRSVQSLEKVCADLIRSAKEKNLKMKGPTTRKTPCGEGSKTCDRFQMRIHKRLIDLRGPSELVKQVTSIRTEPRVEAETPHHTVTMPGQRDAHCPDKRPSWKRGEFSLLITKTEEKAKAPEEGQENDEARGVAILQLRKRAERPYSVMEQQPYASTQRYNRTFSGSEQHHTVFCPNENCGKAQY
ncbi:hypothetical protein EI555_013881 [Monodon monoceros]|uniref:Small ribosomal subunit protein uS10 n=1 Tax=Monodon monoceros TaxID=40151 RepID=A0A4U1F5T9_MONMO|nr:hypothetical protein EI555_013881 [Monodon monoceros]